MELCSIYLWFFWNSQFIWIPLDHPQSINWNTSTTGRTISLLPGFQSFTVLYYLQSIDILHFETDTGGYIHWSCGSFQVQRRKLYLWSTSGLNTINTDQLTWPIAPVIASPITVLNLCQRMHKNMVLLVSLHLLINWDAVIMKIKLMYTIKIIYVTW